LQTALEGSVGPGTTIWLRGGTYEGSFKSWLEGTADAPIIVRAYPGELATLDVKGRSGHALEIRGKHTWFWGLEVTNSTDRTSESGGDSDRGHSVTLGSSETEGIRLINMIIHETGGGVGLWKEANDVEIYGCIIYNNGWQGDDRGHGHGIYAQNRDDEHRIIDNILFHQFGYGIHIYGSSRTSLKGFHIEGNILFNSGAISNDSSWPNLLVGGGTPAERITIRNNFVYHSDGMKTNVQLDLNDTQNKDIELRGNYFAGGARTFAFRKWEQVQMRDNTLVGRDTLVRLRPLGSSYTDNYDWDTNAYYHGGDGDPFRDHDNGVGFDSWKQNTGFDGNSSYTDSLPDSPQVFVRPNRYEAGRANIVVFNWPQQGEVSVDVSDVLNAGDGYEVRHVYDLFGAPVASGTYDGSAIRLPMNGKTPPQPNGGWPNTPPTSGPEFNAFVLIRTS
jgi:hypothetical protein